MNRFFPNIESLHRFTLELDHHQQDICCPHCSKQGQLVSHGFVYRKQHNADKAAVAKRIFCANRHGRSGCGRTRQLYLDHIIPTLSYNTLQVFQFLLLLIAGRTIATAYQKATGASEHRNATRWLNRCHAQLTTYRSLLSRPKSNALLHPDRHLQILLSTLQYLFSQAQLTTCQHYQIDQQRPFF